MVHVSTIQGLREWLGRHRIRTAATADAVVPRPKRLPSEQGLDLDKERCCFCLEALTHVAESQDKEIGVVMKMPCGHTFHGHCILEWLLNY